MNGEILSRRYGDAISEGACELIIQDGTRVADVGAELVDEPRLRTDGDTYSMKPVSSDDTLIEK